MRVLRKEVVFRGGLLSVVRKEVQNSDGNIFLWETVTYGGNASVVIPLYKGNFVFVRQFRPTVEDFLLEFPAGRIENGETPIVCARRELEEETGLIPLNLKFIFEIYPSPGFVEEKLYMFFADEFEEGRVNPDLGEEINIVKYDKKTAFKLLEEGRIVDGKTVCGLLWFKMRFGG